MKAQYKLSGEFPLRPPGRFEGTYVDDVTPSQPRPGPAVERFSRALRLLHVAAGEPSYRTLIYQAGRHSPPVTLSSTSLGDWLSGSAVPRDAATVHFLVGLLQSRAVDRRVHYVPQPLEKWLHWHAEARAERQASRGGRPPGLTPTSSKTKPPVGRLIRNCSALDLEVHRSIRVTDDPELVDDLPPYVLRAHDTGLRLAVDSVLAGRSRLVTLVGGASTGKTRACWEALLYLESQMPRTWRVWHPYEPTRAAAAAKSIDRVGPNTVVWLNDASFYLGGQRRSSPEAIGISRSTESVLHERVASGLRAMLTDEARRPVLILATLWPEHWRNLTRRSESGDDMLMQARELIDGTSLRVPDAFTPDELTAIAGIADHRLLIARERAEAGRITQYLAGAPILADRYRHADPAARALLDVAIDATRLGAMSSMSEDLLRRATSSYLDDHDWDMANDDWMEAALDYTTERCLGARGPLSRVRPRADISEPSSYRLADYLEQTGGRARAGSFPPEQFWDALLDTVTESSRLIVFAESAEYCGRIGIASKIYKTMTERGDPTAMIRLAEIYRRLKRPEDAISLARQAVAKGSTEGLRWLAARRQEADDLDGAEALCQQAADLGDELARQWLDDVYQKGYEGDIALLRLRSESVDDGTADAATIDYRGLVSAALNEDREVALPDARAAAAQGYTLPLFTIAEQCLNKGDVATATDLLVEAADWGDTGALWLLAEMRALAGDMAAAVTLVRKAAELGDTDPFDWLAELSAVMGDLTEGASLYIESANRGSNYKALIGLADIRRMLEDPEGAARIETFGIDARGGPGSPI